MLIFTSYYAKMSRNTSDDYLYVRVSVSKPKWFNSVGTQPELELPELYPNWMLVNDYKNGIITWDDYVNEYKKTLTNDLRDQVLNKIRYALKETGKNKAVMLCWCTGNCHRHILNEWLEGNGELY